MDQGLYKSDLLPKVNPSYQSLTPSSMSDSPNSFKASDTSSCVNPKVSSYLFCVVVTTSRLFKSEKMLSLLTRVIPVKIARSRQSFVLKVRWNKFVIKATSASQYPFTYASCIGVSYSSNRIITFFPYCFISSFESILSDIAAISSSISRDTAQKSAFSFSSISPSTSSRKRYLLYCS